MRPTAILSIAFILPVTGLTRAQGVGLIQITSPASGEAISGVVTIAGSATHDDFLGYDLAFAYAENPTGTWFPLGEPVQAPVAAGRLGLWDTTGITDGEYSLRLRVWLQDGTALVAQVDGLRVRNQTPNETSTPAPSATPGPTSSPTPRPAAEPAASAAPPRSGAGRVRAAFILGIAGSLFILAALGGYTLARATLRQRWAALRSRALHRRMERRSVRRRGLR
jgi:hypothetical protein